MTTNYKRGYAFERRCADAARKRGALLVVRSGGSKGVADLVAFFNPLIYPDEHVYRTCPGVWLIQAKRDGKLPPHERVALVDVAATVGACPVLAKTGPNGKGVDFVMLDNKGEYIGAE